MSSFSRGCKKQASISIQDYTMNMPIGSGET